MRSLIKAALPLVTLACFLPSLTWSSNKLSSGVILANFDKTVRPQDNFFRYVNGSWLSSTTIPEDQSSAGALIDLDNKTRKDLLRVIKNLHSDGSASAELILNLYHSFIAMDERNMQGFEPIAPYIKKIEQISTHQQLMEYFSWASQHDVLNPITAFINIDKQRPSHYILNLYQGGLSLPNRDYYLENTEQYSTIRAQYKRYISETLTLIKHSTPTEDAERILTLETAIAHIHWDKVKNRDKTLTSNPRTRQQLSALSSTINWLTYIENISYEGILKVNLAQPSYFDALSNLLIDRPLSEWKLLCLWHLLVTVSPYLSEGFVAANFDFFNKALRGQQQPKPLEEKAIKVINQYLGEPLGKFYVAEYFPATHKAKILDMIESLRRAFKQSIEQSTWMSQSTKHEALKKLTNMTPKVGFPDKWRDYSSLKLQPHTLLDNVLSINAFTHNQDIIRLQEPVRHWEWEMPPQTVNAYFHPGNNAIVFPAAILQPPFFDIHADDAINYGAIGAIIGHEMSHAFDDQGAKYDSTGLLRNWWTEKDHTQFKAKTRGLIKQYNRYEVLNKFHVNGELTLGENIADLSGVSIAHLAYKLSLDEKQAPVIDNFTGEQRFFIGWAQSWRQLKTEQSAKLQVNTDVHSPAEFRVNGSLRNIDAFYQAFDVKASDKLYLTPQKRVYLWQNG